MNSATRSIFALPSPQLRLDPAHFDLRDHVSALRSHLQQCSQARGWWFRLAALGEQLHAVIAPRLISTVTGATLVFGVVALCA